MAMPDPRVLTRLRSKCHGASVHDEDGGPDFIEYGTPAESRRVECRTCWFVCDECGEPCDVERADV